MIPEYATPEMNVDMRLLQELSHEQRLRLLDEQSLTPRVQISGALQELGELSAAYDKNEFYDDVEYSHDEIRKEVGDIIIYLTGFCALQDYDIEHCIQLAADDWLSRDSL